MDVKSHEAVRSLLHSIMRVELAIGLFDCDAVLACARGWSAIYVPMSFHSADIFDVSEGQD